MKHGKMMHSRSLVPSVRAAFGQADFLADRKRSERFRCGREQNPGQQLRPWRQADQGVAVLAVPPAGNLARQRSRSNCCKRAANSGGKG